MSNCLQSIRGKEARERAGLLLYTVMFHQVLYSIGIVGTYPSVIRITEVLDIILGIKKILFLLHSSLQLSTTQILCKTHNRSRSPTTVSMTTAGRFPLGTSAHSHFFGDSSSLPPGMAFHFLTQPDKSQAIFCCLQNLQAWPGPSQWHMWPALWNLSHGAPSASSESET
jgi:hypothetical protein